jgi:hypothetical protein
MEEEFEDMEMDMEQASAIEDVAEDDYTDPVAGQIVSFVKQKFNKAETARQMDEERWIKAYRNYRGTYGSDVQFTSTEKSRIFVKVTKTKTLAAYGQIADVLFGGNKFPLSIDPTKLPDGVEETVNFETNEQLRKASEDTNQEQLLPGETYPEFKERLAGLTNKLEPVIDDVKSGTSGNPTAVQIHPADVAAKKMEKKIHDQLEESHAKKHLRAAAFECALFGTGIMKGPFAIDKEYANWNEEGEYSPVYKTIPQTSSVSIWNFYPDPDASTMEEAEFVVERHKMSRSQVRALKNRPYFRSNAIDNVLKLGENYRKEWWEQVMEDHSEEEDKAERFEVLEFWGFVDREIIEDQGVDIPSELKDADQLSVNIWIANSQVIRLVMNPFTPAYIPYFAAPYEMNPYSIFGVGIAENMDDTQTLMNGFMRMAVDNAALSGNLLIEVDETNLVPGQDLSVYPGKVFRRQGGAPGQAIFGTKFPNVSNENMQMFDKARVLADESTGFPSFAHGQTGVSGVGRTASGISMLMSAANGSIRNVVKNIDDYLLAPLGKAFFNFNMQFDFDKEIKGDLEVKARGTESLMANEVRSQRLMQFLQVVQNPALAPFARMDYIVREIAKSMDLDPDKVGNNMAEAAVQAEILKQFQAANPPEPQPGVPGPPPAGPQGAPAGVQVQDTQGSGGGTIGTGTVPTPGEQGFSGNTGPQVQ